MALSQSWISAYQNIQKMKPLDNSQESLNEEISSSKLHFSKQVEFFLWQPEIADFYNLFFKNSEDILWKDWIFELKEYFLDLLHNDLEKAVYFMIESIQYSLNKLVSLQYYRNNPFPVKYLNDTMVKLQELDDKIRAFYDFQDKSSVDNNVFADFVLSWRVNTAYNFAVDKIKREKEVLEEVRSKILKSKVQVDFKQLPSFKNWMKKLEKLTQEFWYLQTNFN